MQKLYFITLFLIIVLLLFGANTLETVNIGLIPLDSRPANTQYPQILGSMGNAHIQIPWDYLDNYLEPAPREALWCWLRERIDKFDEVIINTTQLFNGGLIASRDPDSYKNMEINLDMFEEFCRENEKKKIIVITVLPRLLPSQFTELWDYQDDLVTFAQEVDKSALLGSEPPPPPTAVPEEILQDYLNIYENARQITKKLISFANQGLIDELLIGQDDAQEFGLSNKIVREIRPLLNDRIHFVQGADELTMLALAKSIVPEPKTAVKILYANENLKKTYFPFEAQKLGEVVQTKMGYVKLQMRNNDKPEDKKNILQFIYNDPEKIDALQKVLNGDSDNNSRSDDSYLGIMDIAFTNRGDIKLYDYFLNNETNRRIQGYAGWNTASNTIGTELAHYTFYQYLLENFWRYSKEAQEKALESYIEFKFIRVAEDLLYQGILRDKLNEELKARGIDSANLGERKSEAEEILQSLYKEYRTELEDAFKGEQQIGKIKFTVENISSRMELPWARTFEAKVVPEVNISFR